MPGMIIGPENQTNKNKPLSVSGMVYCYVDASKEPIAVGDLLTSSSTVGHAMKASDPFLSRGAIIGKAMEPFSAGKGLILILVTLQ